MTCSKLFVFCKSYVSNRYVSDFSLVQTYTYRPQKYNIRHSTCAHGFPHLFCSSNLHIQLNCMYSLAISLLASCARSATNRKFILRPPSEGSRSSHQYQKKILFIISGRDISVVRLFGRHFRMFPPFWHGRDPSAVLLARTRPWTVGGLAWGSIICKRSLPLERPPRLSTRRAGLGKV